MGGTAFHGEIIAFCQLTGAEPTPWDVSMLRRLYRFHAEAEGKKAKGQGAKPITDARDGKAVGGLLRGLGAKRATQP